MIRRGWDLAQAGELTLPAAQFLMAQEPHHDGVWQLMDFLARALGGKGVVPAKAVKLKEENRERVIPEFQKSLMAAGWTPPKS